MALKEESSPTEWETVDRWEGGVGWLAHPAERMQRASHALALDGEVWVVDPLDVPGLDELLSEYGEVAGVVVTLDRHTRDAALVARRHGVPVHLPAMMDGTAAELNVPTETFTSRLADTGVEAHVVMDNPFWKEVALFDPDGRTLLAGDSLGTGSYFLAEGERLGVHPMLRPFPPRSLRDFEPRRVLVGHGRGVMEDAPAALRSAIDGARGHWAEVWLKGLRGMLPGRR